MLGSARHAQYPVPASACAVLTPLCMVPCHAKHLVQRIGGQLQALDQPQQQLAHLPGTKHEQVLRLSDGQTAHHKSAHHLQKPMDAGAAAPWQSQAGSRRRPHRHCLHPLPHLQSTTKAVRSTHRLSKQQGRNSGPNLTRGSSEKRMLALLSVHTRALQCTCIALFAPQSSSAHLHRPRSRCRPQHPPQQR